MKYFKTTVAALTLTLALSTTANAQLFGGFDNNTVLAGGAGAGLGAVIGRQIAPRGNRTEGAAIGALVGGLGGAAYGNQKSRYGGNPYAGQFNPGFNGRNLIGTGAGAALGGVIGSNIAGRGQRQEGTAIGAVLGGAAGYALANRGQNQQQFSRQQFGGRQFGGQTIGLRPQAVYSGQTVTQYYPGPSRQYIQQVPTYPAPAQQYVAPPASATPTRIVSQPPARPAVQNRVVQAPPVIQRTIVQAPVIHRTIIQRTIVQEAPIIQERTIAQETPAVQEAPYVQDAPYAQPVAAQHTESKFLCYGGKNSKRYDSWGQEIKGPSCSK
ncbi:MAG: glycine zipper domain-containing protein [Maricaulaceae bacterium]